MGARIAVLLCLFLTLVRRLHSDPLPRFLSAGSASSLQRPQSLALLALNFALLLFDSKPEPRPPRYASREQQYNCTSKQPPVSRTK